MKFQLTFKTPDVLDELQEDLAHNFSDQETEEEIKLKLAEQYVEHGEYLTVEFDTETKTATVVKVRE